MRAFLTALVLLPVYVFAMIGETPPDIARKMGEPIKTDVRPNTEFPQLTYGLVYASRGWLPIASVQAKAEEAAKANRKSELDQIERWLKETWGVQVVYVDGKSMCEAWIPIQHKVTTDHARLIFRVYQGEKKWTKLDAEEAAAVARAFQEDLSGKPGEGPPMYLLRADDASMHIIVYETHISVFAKDYTERIRPARIAGEKNQKEQDDAFLERVGETPLALLDWHWKVQYDHAIVEGQVMNLTDRRIDNIEAVAVFKTADGALVTSDSSLIEYRPLLPGQTSPFKIYATANPAMKTASMNFKTMWGPTIPYMTKDELERAKSIIEKRKQNQSMEGTK